MFVHILCWFLIAWYTLGSMVMPHAIGKPRKPMTPGQATASIVLSVLTIFVLGILALS